MKPVNSIVLALSGLLFMGQAFCNPTRQSDSLYLKNRADSLIRLTWKEFSKAVLRKDMEKIKAMSTACVHCRWCATNTAREDSIFRAFPATDEKARYEHLYGQLSAIPMEIFLEEDFRLIFTKKTLSRMRNENNYVFTDIADLPRYYDRDCIIKGREKHELDIKEVLLIDIDSKQEQEGLRMAFVFIKVNGRYMFCGFSRVP